VLGKTGIAREPPLWALHPLDLEERMEIAVGAQTPQEEGTARPGVRGAARRTVAETVHIGPYAQLPLACNALFAAIHERGLRPYVRPISSGRQRHRKQN
jgi:effector-binding domain-containing protein